MLQLQLSQKKENRMRVLLLSATIILSSLSYGDEIVKDGKEYPIDKIKEQNRKVIHMALEGVSKELPKRVNKYTQMVKVRDKNLTLIYTFEINAAPKSDETIRKEGKAKMEKYVSRGICQSSKRFLDSGIAISYEYLSAVTKKELFTFTLTQKKCEELKY